MYKEWKYHIIAIHFVAAAYWLPISIYTAISIAIVFYLLSSTSFVVNKRIFSVIFPVVLLLPIGLINAWQWRVSDIVRDCWYVINPLIILLAGWLYCEKIEGDIAAIFKAIIISGVVSSLNHIFKVSKLILASPGGLGGFDSVNLSENRGSVLAVMALSVLIFSNFRDFVEWKTKTKFLIVLICSGSFFLSLSRSWLISMVIFFIVIVLLKTKNGRSFFSFGVLISLPILFFILMLLFSSEKVECTGVTCDVLESIMEVVPKDYLLVQDLNTYWRGYETYMGLQQYKEGSAVELFFGQGLGALIDLRLPMKLGGTDFDKIPILHNGYVYLLVKFGLAGLLIFIMQCVVYVTLGLQYFNDMGYAKSLIGAYILSLTVIIIVLTFANAGFFNKYSLLPVLFFMAVFIRSGSMNQTTQTLSAHYVE